MSALGPFRADQLRSGDPYELSRGHAIRVSPTGGQGSGANLLGGAVILTDPAVKNAGVDAGFAPTHNTLRAPDIAILPENPAPGWVQGVPPLAIEYAGPGQDEEKLAEKIADLLAHGTQHMWVVRLSPIPRVEVWHPDGSMSVVNAGELLSAPGFLANDIPAEALWSPAAGERVIMRNMLQRYGYQDLDEVRLEGREEGREAGQAHGLREAIHAAMAARGAPLSEAEGASLNEEKTLDSLRALMLAAVRGEPITLGD